MRIAVGGYIATANSFATERTGLEDFQRSGISGDKLLTRIGNGDNAIAGFLRGARRNSWEVIPLNFFFPPLAGKITDEAHEWAKDALVSGIRKSNPLDGIFLQMHGTAASESIADCDGDLLAAVREVIGSKTPLIVSLDGHANVSREMVAQATMLIGVKTNPHYDFIETGELAASVMAGMFERSISPAVARAQPAIVAPLQKLYIAPGWPMDHLVRIARNRAAGTPKVLDISLLGGFFVSDRFETGLTATVTTNGEPSLANDIAEELKEECWARREQFLTDMVPVADAVREAIATEEYPVILGDIADSGGAGTPGDGTAILAELIRQEARGAVIGNIADPAAVRQCIEAGIGKSVKVTVGGKVDRFHGDPVTIEGRVRVIHDGVYTASTRFNFGTYHRGPTVVLDCGGIEVILTSRRSLVFEANHFRSVGIEPSRRKILVCKAELQHRAGMAEVGRTFIDVDAPGLATQDLRRLPFKEIRRPVFPLDDM
jgi:microcystin degradation protein MlrC